MRACVCTYVYAVCVCMCVMSSCKALVLPPGKFVHTNSDYLCGAEVSQFVWYRHHHATGSYKLAFVCGMCVCVCVCVCVYSGIAIHITMYICVSHANLFICQ